VTKTPDAQSPIPWDALIGFGLARLRLSPHDFWALSLKELTLMAAPLAPLRALGPVRSDLEALARLYPDGEPDGRE
tara:strand:- start:6 stop:233 length:228 start_codon:yes stop_codon:yes gene_type:complete